MAVKMEIGISAAVAALAKVSITIIKKAPRPMLMGMTLRLLFPPIILEIWGIKSPTQPTCPHMETQEAVIMDETAINTRRISWILVPRELASSSFRERMFNLHRRAKISATPARIKGAPIIRLL